jgi:hypothetical protein
LGKTKRDFVFFVCFVCTHALAAAQSVTGTLSNITRVESWSYFEPRTDLLALSADPLGDPDYTFVGDRAELGVRVEGARFDLSGAFNYVRIENLPTDAIGPGGLGPGAFYFAAVGTRYSYQLYISELLIRVKSADENVSLAFGRMPYVRLRAPWPASSKPSVDEPGSGLPEVTARRIDGRLLGNFEWSYYQRRFDGVSLDVSRHRWRFNGSVFMPTQGGFEESTNLTMTKLQVGTASATRLTGRSDSQVFAYLYRDRRSSDTAVVDNTFAPDQPVNVTIGSFGASHAHAVPLSSGDADLVAWGVVQAGDWYGTPHRAASIALEAGHRWTRASWRPWLRGGILWASGDADAVDGEHHTFFQMLPSSQQYALSSVYSQMNVKDAFIQAWVEPGGVKARIEVHAVALADGADLWYQGSGATASRDRFFGFAGRDASGETGLGTVLEGTIDVPIKKFWSVNAYAGTMWAGAAVRQQFTDKRLTFWSLENVFRF